MIQNEFAKTVLEYGMFNTGDKVVVGVSGGSDSVCLLHLLSGLKKLRLELIVAHFNHRLRGKESERDEKFVKKHQKNLDYHLFQIAQILLVLKIVKAFQ